MWNLVHWLNNDTPPYYPPYGSPLGCCEHCSAPLMCKGTRHSGHIVPCPLCRARDLPG